MGANPKSAAPREKGALLSSSEKDSDARDAKRPSSAAASSASSVTGRSGEAGGADAEACRGSVSGDVAAAGAEEEAE